jgi:apolipoprotein N-acyltransferase
VGRYDKVRLLAFGEYVPAIEAFPWLRKVMPEGIGRFTAGPGPGVLPLTVPDGRQWHIGPVICYEDILPSYLRRVGALHPDLLVNLTSDSWFGARAEPWQHLALAVFASVELRVAAVRAVDTGVSTMIDPDGRVQRRTYAVDPFRDPHPPDRLLVTVPVISGGRTLFTVAGNWFAELCLGATILGIVFSRRRRMLALGGVTAETSPALLRPGSSGT